MPRDSKHPDSRSVAGRSEQQQKILLGTSDMVESESDDGTRKIPAPVAAASKTKLRVLQFCVCIAFLKLGVQRFDSSVNVD